MDIDYEMLRTALSASKDRAAKKYLSATAETLRREEPERCAAWMKEKYTKEPCRTLARRCKCVRVACIFALIVAAAVIVTAYLLGDFGATILTGWAHRYQLSIAILAAMGLVVLAGLQYGNARDRLLAAALLQERTE